LRRMLEPYAARLTGFQGHHAFPHTVMGLAIKGPSPSDASARLSRLAAAYVAWARDAEAALPARERIRRLARRIYRSNGERRQVADYSAAAFQIDAEPVAGREAHAA